MAQDVRVPRLGWSMEEGIFHGWLKRHGDVVRVGDPLYELEGEKATQEIESIDEGVLHVIAECPKPGETVVVGTLLAYLLAPGEKSPNDQSPPKDAETSLPPASENGNGTADSQSRSTEANEKSSSLPFVDDRRRLASSPRARRIAKELGIDWKQLDGTGERGQVRESDVRLAASKINAPAMMTSASLAPAKVAEFQVGEVLSKRRQAIADRMRMSQARTAPVTLFASADAANLIAFREQFKQTSQYYPVPTYAVIIAVLCADALRKHSRLAARWNADQTRLHLPEEDGYHIGVAVDTPEGLVVPVLRDVSISSFGRVAFQSQQLIENARSGDLKAVDMQGGVFTVTSLGSFGVTHFTPIINYPEIAILGVGAIRREAVVLDDERIVPGQRISLSLTFDHAAIDGAPAAAFLRDLRMALEDPISRLGHGD